MSARVRLGLAVAAGLVSVALVAVARGNTFSTARLSAQGSSPRLPAIPYTHDVGVLTYDPAPDVYISAGDTFFPRCIIRNLGTESETDVPVSCFVYDTASGTTVYGQTVHVASLDSGGIATVEFPYWVPSPEKRVYLDTMAVALPGDEFPANDKRPGRVTVLEWGAGHLTYNDGTFENGYSWVPSGNELAVRFTAAGPLQIDKAVLWLTSFTGSDYDAEVRVYANDGYDSANNRSIPGTRLGTWTGRLHSDVLWFFHMNEVTFDPPVVVDSDTFFVSYFQTTTSPAYPYLAVDTTPPVEPENDWGRYQGSWGFFDLGGALDFGIDVTYGPAGIASERAAIGRASLTIAPNPAGRFTTVRYSLPGAGLGKLEVYDVGGRNVLEQTIAAGRSGAARLDLRALKPGVYLVKVEAGGFSSTQKVVVDR